MDAAATLERPGGQRDLGGPVLLGLLLLFLAARRGKPATLALRRRTPGVDVTASRTSVERSLAAAVSRRPGITGATPR